MATENTTTITINITLKNGQCFEHHPPKESFEEQFKFMKRILNEWTKIRSGVLTLTYPVALYNLNDVSSIHFPDMVQSPDIVRLPIGFHPSE